MLLWLCSCSPKVITVPEIHTQYISKTDTFLQRDSVVKEHNTVIREADSTMLAELGIKLVEGQRAILVLRSEIERLSSQQREAMHDTVVQRDSIPYPVEVEKELSWWQEKKIEFGELALAILLIVIVYVVIKFIIKK